MVCIATAKILLFTLTKVDLIQFNECGCNSLSCIFWGIGGLHYSSRICPSSFLLRPPPNTITIDLQVERLISLGREVYNDKRTFCLCIAGPTSSPIAIYVFLFLQNALILKLILFSAKECWDNTETIQSNFL